MGLLVVGSVGLDTVATPFDKVEDALGGSATYISLASSYFCAPVDLVGIVGDDFPKQYIKLLEEHNALREDGHSLRRKQRGNNARVSESLDRNASHASPGAGLNRCAVRRAARRASVRSGAVSLRVLGAVGSRDS